MVELVHVGGGGWVGAEETPTPTPPPIPPPTAPVPVPTPAGTETCDPPTAGAIENEDSFAVEANDDSVSMIYIAWGVVVRRAGVVYILLGMRGGRALIG